MRHNLRHVLNEKAEHAVEQAYEEIENREVSTKRPTEVKVEPIQDNVSVLFVGIDDSEQRGQGEGSVIRCIAACYIK